MTTFLTRRPTTVVPKPKGGSSDGAQTSCPVTVVAEPEMGSRGGTPNSTVNHIASETQNSDVDGGPNSDPANSRTLDQPNLLFDPFLALAADVLDDAEKVWIASNNRLSIMTRAATDKDGEERGWGLPGDHPDVARLAALVDMLKKVNDEATKNLEKRMRQHPLGPWVKSQKGLGDKQVARLLAAIGDPFWNTLHGRPRTVSELWAYCGFHVLPASQPSIETQQLNAGGTQAGDTNQGGVETQKNYVGVAPKRQRGRKSNWNEDARTRAWLIANKIVQVGGPYREVYYATKDKYQDSVHSSPCARCGPAGKPAQPGSPLSKAHINARGLRAISKAVLRDLWVEAKRLHELPASGQDTLDPQSVRAADRV